MYFNLAFKVAASIAASDCFDTDDNFYLRDTLLFDEYLDIKDCDMLFSARISQILSAILHMRL